MLDTLKIYFRYIGISIRSQMQYKASFLIEVFGNFIFTFVEFIGIWAMFQRFDSLKGWTLPEVALFYGIVNTAFAISEAVARGFDIFPSMVKSGDFDRLLLRPRSTAMQVAAQEIQMIRLGRFLQGIVILIWAAVLIDISWTFPKILLLIVSVLGGSCIFSGLFILQATMSFWSTETLELVNTMTYGGVETAQYPLVIYRTWFRRFFTFVVPLALINYFPALAILGRPDDMGTPEFLMWASPLLGFVFLVITLRIWQFGVRHYTSTGS